MITSPPQKICVHTLVAEHLGLARGDVPDDLPLLRLGTGSLALVTVHAALSAAAPERTPDLSDLPALTIRDIQRRLETPAGDSGGAGQRTTQADMVKALLEGESDGDP